jgi:hypothetical protein
MEPILLAHPSRIEKNYSRNEIILRGICSFCNDKVTFRQVGESAIGELGLQVAIKCEGCQALQVYSINQNKIYPEIEIKGLENLPSDIDKYYQEALRCISHDSPNGAMTLFRKLINQLGIHYGIAKKNDDKTLYNIINELKEKGHIPEKLRLALLEVKDFGNDGAHVNDNEPDISQAISIKSLIDSVLASSIFVDKTLNELDKIKKNS